jgi:hypothetical protein
VPGKNNPAPAGFSYPAGITAMSQEWFVLIITTVALAALFFGRV